jgi:predicted branched-subunit amino acid permease
MRVPHPAHPTQRTAFRLGLVAGAPFTLVVFPFGMVFGIIAIEHGLSVAQAMGFSVLVIAGAAQLAALQLMSEGAPFVVVVLTALAVNLRMAMYSASMAPHLGRASLGVRAAVAYLMVDQAYATAFLQFERTPDWPLGSKLAFYFGAITPVAPLWYLGSLIGTALGGQLAPDLPVDFIVPITFLALVGPMLRTVAHGAAAAMSVVAALVLAILPWNLGLPLAGLAAMLTGAAVEAQRLRRAGSA